MLALTAAYASRLGEVYGGIVAEISAATNSDLVPALEQMGALLSVKPSAPLGIVRRRTVELALQSRFDTFHFCDFDRVLHWITHYPNELASIVQMIGGYDFLVIGRSTRALDTHPEIQVTTERRSNALLSAEFGEVMDITAASRGISRAAAELILQFSTASDVGTDAEWPLIVRRHSQLSWSYVEVEGLEFETATFFENEVKAAGGLEHWKKQRSESAREQRYRIECVEGITAVARRFAEQRQQGLVR
ncbi:MAG: hypothetical protein HY675_09110 [Chloroflexi bacterium]|nr:hypothetical protein [Chloroflexota bacterium]